MFIFHKIYGVILFVTILNNYVACKAVSSEYRAQKDYADQGFKIEMNEPATCSDKCDGEYTLCDNNAKSVTQKMVCLKGKIICVCSCPGGKKRCKTID